MSAVAIFLASFAVVFAMGVQQYNVQAGRMVFAFITSLVISTTTLVQLKLLPGPTTWLDIAAYFIGSASGIVTSMWVYPRWFKRRMLAGAHLPPPSDGAVKLAETLRLATTIADYTAVADIESMCTSEPRSDGSWWNVADVIGSAAEIQYVANAVDYLHLRGRLTRHEQLPHLVRFAP